MSSKNDLRPPFTAAILAGGRARRLGGIDKSALVIGSASILDRQLSLLRALTPHILIVTSDGSRVERACLSQDVDVVIDRVAGAGALGGIYTALMDAPTEQVIVMGCDMPFLTAPSLAFLAAQGADSMSRCRLTSEPSSPLRLVSPRCASWEPMSWRRSIPMAGCSSTSTRQTTTRARNHPAVDQRTAAGYQSQ